MRTGRVLLLTAGVFTAGLAGCGYHTAGAATHLPPDVHSLAVPIFKNKTLSYHTEVAMTGAVVREFNSRTRYRVTSSNEPGAADAVLHGTVLTETIVPLTYNSTTGVTSTSSYLITVTMQVVLTDRDGKVLYQNPSYLFRQQYQSTEDLSSFVREDGPAIERMSRDFAQTLVSDVLESF